ncbi:hypothetical protein IU433_07290 [Nocardia puris]|uniref:Uncharacterized protein n=1 Tax=Nocardia puris TaxID=208602 RepID=A0A366DMN3_9NOCA|nr:hypothetical protein [Nocardia puris]MBF6211342.1 hypothetical protein [Nocardia puris]MBF6365060.1 hypothetical protein [Nocardia puris]MBF6458845.1 hypothetical protein [Nocardia puris]RBO90699.1 hypothetical protein DFR74_105101 [Nocardia puris]
MATQHSKPEMRGLGRIAPWSQHWLSPTSLITTGLLLLIPVLIAMGPLVAALLIQLHQDDAGPRTVALVAVLICSVALLVGAAFFFSEAWRTSHVSRADHTAPHRPPDRRTGS